VYIQCSNLGAFFSNGNSGTGSPWTLNALVRTIGSVETSGLIDGLPSEAIVACSGANLTHAWFVMPAFEGTVYLYLQYALPVSTAATNFTFGGLPFTSLSPRVSSVVTLLSTNDPCALLRSAVQQQESSQCVMYALAALQRETLRSLVSSAPEVASSTTMCINALVASSTFLGAFSDQLTDPPRLNVSGFNFGSGLQLLVNVSSFGTRFSCKILPVLLGKGRASVLCDLPSGYSARRGNASVEVAAFAAVASSVGAVDVHFECPCGFYASGEGQRCIECPSGAICGGASLRPVARVDYFKTDAAQWLSERNVVVDPRVAGFVRCPRNNSCLPNGQCAKGYRSNSWMCVNCADGFVPASDNTCIECVAGSSDIVAFVVLALAALLAILLGIVFGFWLSRNLELTGADMESSGTITILKRAVQFVRLCALSSSLRVIISFAQTVAILYRYFRYTGSQLSVGETNSFLLTFLDPLRPLLDYGRSITLLQCYYRFATPSLVALSIALPFACYLVGPLVSVVFSLISSRCFVRITADERRHFRDLYTTFALFLSTMLFTAFITPALGYMTSALRCAPLADGYYLYDDPEVSCADKYYATIASASRVVAAILLAALASLVVCLFCGIKWLHAALEFWWLGFTGTVPTAQRTKQKLEALDNNLSMLSEIARLRREALKAEKSKGTATPDYLTVYRTQTLSGMPYVHEALSVLRRCILVCISTEYFGVADAAANLISTAALILLSLVFHTVYLPLPSAAENGLIALELLAELVLSVALIASLTTFGIADDHKQVIDAFAVIILSVFLLAWFAYTIDAAASKNFLSRKFQVCAFDAS
jgi:hypothetical protein